MNQGVVKVEKGNWLGFVSHNNSVAYLPKLAKHDWVNVALTKVELNAIKS